MDPSALASPPASATASATALADAALDASLDAAARAALASAPADAARLLAAYGCWWLVLSPRATVRLSLRTRLRWLRASAARGALRLAERRTTPPAEWVRLLRACLQEDSSGNGYTGEGGGGDDGECGGDDDGGGGGTTELDRVLAAATGDGDGHGVTSGAVLGSAAPFYRQGAAAGSGLMPSARIVVDDDPDGATAADVADASMLLRLALLPPPPSVDASAALGAQLEPFVRQWLASGWPRKALVAELRVRMQSTAPAVCWLLEHCPALMAKAALGPELLLDCIRVVATS